MSVITSNNIVRIWFIGFPSNIELLYSRFSTDCMSGFWDANLDNNMLVDAYAQSSQTIEDYCKDYFNNNLRKYLGNCAKVQRIQPDKTNYIDFNFTYTGNRNICFFTMYDATTHKSVTSNDKSDVIFCKENGVYTDMTQPANNGYNQIVFGIKYGYCGGFFVNGNKFGTIISVYNTNSSYEYDSSKKSVNVHNNVIVAYNATIGGEFVAELPADEFKSKTDNGTFEEWLKTSKYLNKQGTTPTTKEVTKITITNTETTLNIGDTVKITCDIEPTDADDKTFTLIADNSNVSITNDEITAVKEGSSNITAITKNNVKDTKQFTIQKKTTPIEPDPQTTESKPISYKDNSNVNVELNIDYSKQGDNLTTFDFEKYFIDQKYGYDIMSVNFRFNTAENYSYTPFINFIINDGTIETTNGIEETSLDYQYSCNIEFAENSGIFQFRPNGVTKWLDYSKLTKIEIACGVIAQTSGMLPNDFNLIGVYEVTKENLSMLLQKNNRFIIRNYAEATETAENELVDLSKYLIMCYKSFIKIDFEKTNENIILGGYATNIKANEKTDLITVHETNEIVLNGFYGNSLDNDSEIILHLPNYNNYKLDSNFINHKLKLRFICDVTNNSMMIEIMIDDVTVDVVNSLLGYRIPLLNGQTNSTDIINSYLFNQNSNIRIDVLYNEIVSNKITTNKKDMIKNFNGFARFQYAQYNFSLTENEQKELNAILLNGVYLPNAV